MSDNQDIFLNSEKFFKKVEELVKLHKYSYLDGTVQACEYFAVDPEDVHKLKLVNAALKDRLQLDGMNEGYLKKQSQLPL